MAKLEDLKQAVDGFNVRDTEVAAALSAGTQEMSAAINAKAEETQQFIAGKAAEFKMFCDGWLAEFNRRSNELLNSLADSATNLKGEGQDFEDYAVMIDQEHRRIRQELLEAKERIGQSLETSAAKIDLPPAQPGDMAVEIEKTEDIPAETTEAK